MKQSKARLEKIAKGVFDKLPKHDQVMLIARNTRVTLRDFSTVKGFTKTLATVGIDIDDDGTLRTILTMGYKTAEFSDAVCEYLIAHEYAHIVLGHYAFLALTTANQVYGQEELDSIKVAFAEHADFLAVITWRFSTGALEAARSIGCTTSFMKHFAQTAAGEKRSG